MRPTPPAFAFRFHSRHAQQQGADKEGETVVDAEFKEKKDGEDGGEDKKDGEEKK